MNKSASKPLQNLLQEARQIPGGENLSETPPTAMPLLVVMEAYAAQIEAADGGLPHLQLETFNVQRKSESAS